MKKHFLCLLLLGGTLSGYATGSISRATGGGSPLGNSAVAEVTQQGVTVKGVVKDAKGEPIIGASVTEKGTNNATVTDLDGNYSLKVKSHNAMLVVSYIGFTSQEVKAGSNVTLLEDNALLNEVVVIGYGTQRKGDVTSAVASVKAEDFNAGKIGDAAELVKGKIAGLSVINSSGDPKASSSIMLRGITTLMGNVSPLVLVDGIEGSLSMVAPENIASIDVLKDASAAAIYGTRGANGVILITTKTGKRESHAEVTYNGYASFSNWTKKAEFMDTHDVIYGLTQQEYLGYDTDWLKAITRKAGFKHNHDVNISGGSKNATYSANIAYSKEEGIIRKTFNENFKMQMDYTQYMWDDILKFNLNALVTRHKYSNDNLNTYSHENAYRQALIHNPSEPVYNEDGSYYENFNKLQYYNPLALQNESWGDTRSRFMQLAGNVTVEPIKGWKTNLMISWGEGVNTYQNWTSPQHQSIVRQGWNGIANKSEGTWINKNLELTSRYDAQWGEHRFNALVGYSYLYNEGDGFNAGNENFSTTAFLWNNLGNGSFLTDKDHHAWMGSYMNDSKLVGFFGRISYGYADRYNALISIRHEGSSKFGRNHKWATFPSVSLGWNIMNEAFMKDTRSWLDNLRLRVGFGVTGITPTNSYLAQNLYGFADWGDVLSMNGNWIKTLEVVQNPNPDLKWETTREWNFGLDYSVLNNRIHGTLDVYVKTTKDLLYDYAVPVPPNLYGYTTANVGEMRNTGIEFMIEAIPVQTKDFEWTTTITASHNANKLLSLSNDLYVTDNFLEVGGVSDPINTTTHCMEVGHTLGDFWGLKFVGYDKDGFALVEVSDGNGGWTVKPFDTELNKKENRQRLGNGMPKVNLGWSNTFRYKDFDLSMQFTSQLGYKILNVQRCFYENNSIAYNRLKTAADLHPAINPDGTPYLDENGNQVMVKMAQSMKQGWWSDHLENGNFLKLTNITLGYTFIPKGSFANYVKRARIYANATNLFCITSYSGLDPEVSNYFLYPGIDDRDKYPTTRNFTVGVSFTF
ncbi:MAG: TonB-dependent receptor [Prevotella sp.]|nr:TonB-dependent receptor [Prevotella sp.]